MLAYKTQINIKSDSLFLKLPSNFKGKRVEIIILETDNENAVYTNNLNDIEMFYETISITNDEHLLKSQNQVPNEFQKFLLTSPTWSDEEYQSFAETRNLFNQWKID